MTPAERIPITGFFPATSAVTRRRCEDALLWAGFSSAVSIVFSIAVSQILMGAALLLLLFLREPVNLPPIRLPLALFVAATIVADLLSGHPLAGMPQIRKFYVFGIIAVASAIFRDVARFKALLLSWVGIGLLSACDGFLHVLARHREALELKWNTYDYYLDDRIKGFSSHWMTFGGEQMIILLLLVSFLLFARPRPWRWIGWLAALVIWISLMLGLTRSIFLLGVPVGALYLLWARKPQTLLLLPVLAVASYFVMPFQVRERVRSVIIPHGDLDSNTQRFVTRRTGWEMVKAHPWFGIGPEQIKPQFTSYVPSDIPRPLPNGWYGHLHNIYLQYAAERGVPALIFLLWIIARMLIDFTRSLRRELIPPEHRYIVYGGIAVVLAILAEGCFEYNLGDSEVLTMFLVVTTGAYAAIGMARRTCS